jgi:hypothetical protein
MSARFLAIGSPSSAPLSRSSACWHPPLGRRQHRRKKQFLRTSVPQLHSAADVLKISWA